MSDSASGLGRKSGRRKRNRQSAESTGSTFNQLPWRTVRNPFPPFKFITDDQVEDIHNASLKVLEETGIAFLLPEARVVLKQAGAEVDESNARVRFPRGLIIEHIVKAPSEFTMHARNPDHNMTWGGNVMNFAMVASPPNVSALDIPRRTGTFDDYCNFLKLAQSLNIIHMAPGYPVEPTDIPPRIRHLDAFQGVTRLTDKAALGYALGRERMLDCIEMARIAHGLNEEQLNTQPSIFTVVNANSPLQYDTPMLQGTMEMALRNQPVIITPFTLSGAMAPVTLAGALVQQNAEALAGLAFIQMVNPGAPCVYGGFTSNVDMKSGSPAFGTPEHTKATIIGGQLARRYNLPYRASNVNASNAPDAQAVYESQMTIWACMLGHCNMMMHGAGWIEGGLCASFEKVIIDAEMLQMMSEFLQPLATDPDSLAVDVIDEVGPGGHFFGTQHTIERYENAFYSPILSDWSNFENWTDKGSKNATQRAHEIYKDLLDNYETPPLDPAIDEELDAFIKMRKEQGGVSEN
ncbi:MAG: trimethylamine methyltransferase family protein [Rhodospirillales bacterium]|nr:trimethylamine methyltransferase family protein [Rhodospirillales bacterium]